MKPSIPIKEARKILGKTSKEMSDEEIQMTVQDLEVLSNFLFERYLATQNNSEFGGGVKKHIKV